MPGSGKSTCAKTISASFNIPLIDSDDFIELKYKMTISQLFDLVGENGFRKLENEALPKILKSDNYVLATGGGLPCFFNNLILLKSAGETIYLKNKRETIYNRLLAAKKIRPLTHFLEDNELCEYVDKLFTEREKYYNQAKYILNAESENIINFVKAIHPSSKK